MQIFVLGMHRSGTSALTRLLGLLGVDVGAPSDMHPADAANPTGYWERREVHALDEEILAALNASWCEPLQADPDLLATHEREAFELRAQDIVSALDRQQPWAVKDPRLSLLFPLWKTVLKAPVCILVHRDPLEVARSLKTRDGFPLPLGLALWEAYARAALSGSEGLPRLLVQYSGLVEDPVGTATRLSERLAALGMPIPVVLPEAEIRDFVSPSLRRERSVAGEARELLTPVQAELLRLFEGQELPANATPGPLSRGARELLEASSLQTKTERLREASLRTEVAARAEDVRRFTGIVAERDVLVASLRGRLAHTGEVRPPPGPTVPSQTSDGPGLAVCTIVAKNYLAMARTLCRSFLRHHPGARAFVLLADEVEGAFDASKEPFELLEARELGVPDFADLACRYTVLELATALKPAFLQHLLETKGIEKLVYLDPDVCLYGPLEEVRRFLETADVALTPHILEPIRPDGRLPDERDLLAAGVFNLGFIAIRRSPAALALLDWWEARLHEGAYLDFGRGLFTDQKWMNLAPCFLDRLAVVRLRGYNVAYWNLQERTDLVRTGEGWTVGGEPLRFFHFSGLNPDQPNLVSKHQSRFHLTDLGRAYRELFGRYVRFLGEEGFEETRRLPYRYSRFDDGTLFPERARRIFRELGEERRRFGDPFRTGSGSFLDWLRAPRQAESPMTHFTFYLYRQRPDVMQAFPDPDGVHALAFHDWLVTHAAGDLGVEEPWIESFRAVREQLAARDAERRRDAERAALEAAERARVDAERAAVERAAFEAVERARADAERAAVERAALEVAARADVERAAAAAKAKADADLETAHLVAATAAAVAEEVRQERLQAKRIDEPKAAWKWWGRLILGPDRYRLLRDRKWGLRPKP